MEATPPISKLRWFGRALAVTMLFLLLGMIGELFTVDIGMNISLEGRNMRSIGQALLSGAADNKGELPPEALRDVYSLALYLARDGDLTDGSAWFGNPDRDPALGHGFPIPQEIVLPAKDGAAARINPAFQGAPVMVAVALLPSVQKLAAETPICWTRGLQSDGTWSEDSPFRGIGGNVVFADASTRFCKGALTGFFKWGTKEPTTNIVETLPPGTRIGEYTPTPEDLHRGRVANLWHKIFLTAMASAEIGVPALLMIACSFFVTRPNRSVEARLMGGVVGAICAALFWYALLGPASIVRT